jgi:hypothetical protein
MQNGLRSRKFAYDQMLSALEMLLRGRRGRMRYKLSQHARQEMERRSIPIALVEKVPGRPDQVVPERGGKKAYQSQKSLGGKIFLVRVIVDDAVEPAVVVTAYRATKVEKYWRAL